MMDGYSKEDTIKLLIISGGIGMLLTWLFPIEKDGLSWIAGTVTIGLFVLYVITTIQDKKLIKLGKFKITRNIAIASLVLIIVSGTAIKITYKERSGSNNKQIKNIEPYADDIESRPPVVVLPGTPLFKNSIETDEEIRIRVRKKDNCIEQCNKNISPVGIMAGRYDEDLTDCYRNCYRMYGN